MHVSIALARVIYRYIHTVLRKPRSDPEADLFEAFRFRASRSRPYQICGVYNDRISRSLVVPLKFSYVQSALYYRREIDKRSFARSPSTHGNLIIKSRYEMLREIAVTLELCSRFSPSLSFEAA